MNFESYVKLATSQQIKDAIVYGVKLIAERAMKKESNQKVREEIMSAVDEVVQAIKKIDRGLK